VIGTGRHERSPERLNWRNSYRDRVLDTRLGALQLRIPELRQGSYFPPFLEARKNAEKALVAAHLYDPVQCALRLSCADFSLAVLKGPRS
jgi:transposase-like protein